MSELDPLTPPDADLQDFTYMPLHVARLRDSDLAAEGHPEGCWYAVLLWAASWHQEPAGSLPDNEAVLARLCGLGRDLRTFRKRRDDALRGFVRCSDGRLYHPVVAEAVMVAWRGKVEQRHRAECARIKKANQRNSTDHPSPSFDAFLSQHFPASVPYLSPGTVAEVPRDKPSKRKGEGEGKGDSSSDADASGAAPPSPAADPAKVMFDSGIILLGEAGVPEGQARAMLGRWKQTYGPEAVIVALGKAQREGATDPKAFVEGCLRNGQRAHRGRSDGYRDPLLARQLGGGNPGVGGPS